MTKRQLIQATAEKLDLTEEAATVVMCDVLSVIKEQLMLGEDVRLSGIGLLYTKVIPEHVGRNPKTGEIIDLPRRRKVAFKPSPGLCRELTDNDPADA